MRKRRSNSGDVGDSISSTPAEIVDMAEIAVVNQIQEQIEKAMAADGTTRDRLAGALGFTRAMVDHVLDSPSAPLHDLAAFAAALGISFKITSYRSGS